MELLVAMLRASFRTRINSEAVSMVKHEALKFQHEISHRSDSSMMRSGLRENNNSEHADIPCTIVS